MIDTEKFLSWRKCSEFVELWSVTDLGKKEPRRNELDHQIPYNWVVQLPPRSRRGASKSTAKGRQEASAS